MADLEVNDSRPRVAEKRRKRAARPSTDGRRSGRTVPAPFVFWICFPAAALTAALPIFDAHLVVATAAGIVLCAGAIYLDDRSAFTTSKEMRRAGEPRRQLNGVEVLLLGTALVANVFVALLALVGALPG